MKVIEAFKQIKDLNRKADDLREKVNKCAADMDFENPKYPDQREKVRGWVQAHSDIIKEILRLRTAVQRTNLATSVTIELGGKEVTKTIAEWVNRRRDLAGFDLSMWKMLNDRNLKDGQIVQSDGSKRDVHVRRYYDPEERDNMVSMYKSEPLMIDAKLEVVNAVTDLIE